MRSDYSARNVPDHHPGRGMGEVREQSDYPRRPVRVGQGRDVRFVDAVDDTGL
jgi:hypothetical protein